MKKVINHNDSEIELTFNKSNKIISGMRYINQKTVTSLTPWYIWPELVRTGLITTHYYGPATYGHIDLIVK